MKRSRARAGRIASTVTAALLLASVFSPAGVAQDADLSDIAGFWVYEFTCTDPNGDTFGPPIAVEIGADGTVFGFVVGETIGDMRRGQWAGFAFQVTFRDDAYPVQLGSQEFGYDNVRLNLEPGGDLFVGRHIFAPDLGSVKWCRCNGVRLYRLPEGEARSLDYSAAADLRPLVCRNIAPPDMGSQPERDPRRRIHR